MLGESGDTHKLFLLLSAPTQIFHGSEATGQDDALLSLQQQGFDLESLFGVTQVSEGVAKQLEFPLSPAPPSFYAALFKQDLPFQKAKPEGNSRSPLKEKLNEAKVTVSFFFQAAMAECDPLESLQKEASCSICLDYFSDPVSINCGHSFCRDCITRCSGKSDRRFACPQCRGIAQKRKFRPNRELRNLAEIAKKLISRVGDAARVGGVCPKHQEPLKLFCQEDQTAICVVCDRSQAHRAHTVAPIEEAAQECKEHIQSKLKSLKDERERLQGLKVTGEKRSQKHLQQARAERWKIMSVFKQLHQFQDEQERLLLMWLEDTEKEIVQTQSENDRRISAEISHLGNLIQELEGMNPQPENKSLQDAGSALTRCDARAFQHLTEKFPRVERSLKDLSQKNIILKEALRKFKESLPVELDVQWANVTLDPDTANPHLVLSEDRRSVRWDETPQNLPDNPQRFDTYCSVLGHEGFTAGRHYWEVQLGNRGFWAVGVARHSAWRKGWISLDPSQGIWAVGICGDRFQAFTSFETVQPLNGRPRTIRVSLDYDKGHVAFFDTDNETLAFAFTPTSFNGEKILPFFWVWESRIQLAP